MSRRRVLLWCSLLVACTHPAATAPPTTVGLPRPTLARATTTTQRTLAEDVLAIEEPLLPGGYAFGPLLRQLTADVRARLNAQAAAFAAMSEEEKATKTLALIEAVLLEHHFVYPGRGYVSYLHDALSDVTVDAQGRADLLARDENRARRVAINSNTSATFHIADCDTYSILYVSIGEELGLPIAMVDLPGGDAFVAHNYVVWRLRDGKSIHWEADTGEVRSEARDEYRFEPTGPLTLEHAQQQRAYAVPMTHDEVLGYVHWLAGLAWNARGVSKLALREFEAAAAFWPASPKPVNSIAWMLATSPDPAIRDGAKAVVAGEKLANLWPSANYLDTVASTYAAAGRWDLAQKTEREAQDKAGRNEKVAFMERVKMFEACETFIEPRAEEMAARDTISALRDAGWGNLQIVAAPRPSLTRPALQNRCTAVK